MRSLRLPALLLLLLPLLPVAPVLAQETSPEPVRVTNADDGRTVRLVPGQELEITLTPPSPGEQWQGLEPGQGLYLVQYSENAERTTATLEALQASPEPRRVTARTDRSCFHSGAACPQAFSQWQLDVVVDPGPDADPSHECRSMPMPTMVQGSAYATEESNGARLRVELGNVVLVQLRGCSETYRLPESSGPLFRENAQYQAHGINQSVFRALRLGSTTITSSTDALCFHTTPACALPSRQWSVEVEVVPAPSEQCRVAAAVSLERPTVTATEAAPVTVRAAAGAAVDLYAYTRPSTSYRLVRSGTTGPDGTVSFALRPPANTRLHAQVRDCSPGPSVVLNVRTALTLAVERTGAREYLFSGDSLPARPGGLVVSLYRLTTDGRQVLTAQSRADAASGEWRIVRGFTGTGRFGFVARTGQDLQNAPGSSGVRSLLVF